MTTPSLDLREPEHLVRLWAEEMTQVMAGDGASSGNAWSVLSEAPPDSSTQPDTDVWILVALSGGLRGEIAFRLPAGVASRAAQIFMGEAGEPQAQATAEHKDALLELFRQAAGLTATAIKPARGDVRFQVDVMPAAPTWPASLMGWLRFGQDGPENSMQVLLSAALVAAFRGEGQETAEAQLPDAAAQSQIGQVKLDLLMDVDLRVTLRFGSRRLLLREVLDLCPGSVIALDRQVEDLVDMLLDGRVIARGEVVVVDGNYGLRVTEIASPS